MEVFNLKGSPFFSATEKQKTQKYFCHRNTENTELNRMVFNLKGFSRRFKIFRSGEIPVRVQRGGISIIFAHGGVIICAIFPGRNAVDADPGFADPFPYGL